MNQRPIEQEVINRAVWEACDTFRGTVDPSIYKDYVLTMLFLKYISDVWQDHYNGHHKTHGDQPERIAELMQSETFVLPEEANFYALHAKRQQAGNGERIDNALRVITEHNIGKLRDVFQDISFNSTRLGDEVQKNQILRHLMEDFARPTLNLRPSRVGAMDVIGNAYEFLIKNFASTSGKKAGEFYTPPEISQLIALLVNPQRGETICDPTCGSGSLLMKCGHLIRHRDQSREYELYGQEAIGSTWALAKMNMFLHNESNHRIEWGDTLRAPKLLDEEGQLLRFDVVVANPPFSLEKWGHESVQDDRHHRFTRGLPPRTKGDYAFILHMIATMKEGSGRMAVVVPNGVLFRGAAEGMIRRQLVEENLLDCVIGLPEKLFYGTGISAAILLFRRKKQDDQVLFIDASNDFQDGKNQNQLRQQDIDNILAACRARSNREGYAHLAGLQELAANDFNLNISRYVHSQQDQAEVDFLSLRSEREEIKRQLSVLEEEMDAHLRQLGIIPAARLSNAA